MVKPRFIIGLHVKDKPSLQQIQRTLGVVKLYQQGPSAIQLRVENIRELVPPPPPDRGGGRGGGGTCGAPEGTPPLERVINHFKKFKLITKKEQDFELFCKIIYIIKRGEHLTPEGLSKIVAIKAAMNKGLSEKLKLAFPSVVPVLRPLVENSKTIDPH